LAHVTHAQNKLMKLMLLMFVIGRAVSEQCGALDTSSDGDVYSDVYITEGRTG
jgi:hypothetical protein